MAKGELPAVRSRLNVISERLTMGQVLVRVLSETDPGEGFEAATPDLEDVYFATITDGRRAANAA